MLVFHDQTHTAVTTLISTAVILNSSEISGPLSNGRALKMYGDRCG